MFKQIEYIAKETADSNHCQTRKKYEQFQYCFYFTNTLTYNYSLQELIPKCTHSMVDNCTIQLSLSN